MSEINQIILELNRFEKVALSGELNGKQIQPETQRKLNSFMSSQKSGRNIINNTQNNLNTNYSDTNIPSDTGIPAFARTAYNQSMDAHNKLLYPIVDNGVVSNFLGLATQSAAPIIKGSAIGGALLGNVNRRFMNGLGKLKQKEAEGQKNIKSNVSKYFPKQDPNTVDMISNMNTDGLTGSSKDTVEKIKQKVNPFALKQQKMASPLDDVSATNIAAQYTKDYIPGIANATQSLGNWVHNTPNNSNNPINIGKSLLNDINSSAGTGLHHYDNIFVQAFNDAGNNNVPISTNIKKLIGNSLGNTWNTVKGLAYSPLGRRVSDVGNTYFT